MQRRDAGGARRGPALAAGVTARFDIAREECFGVKLSRLQAE